MKKYYLHREAPQWQAEYEKDLNPEQYAAVMHDIGPALVLAGAGTGKTRVVTYRVARLVETGVPAENILLLTFTNKAAREMMRRVELLIGRKTFGLSGGTFHHIGNLILRRHHLLCGYKEGFSILDREDEKELFDSCRAEVYKKDVVMPKGGVFAEISSLAKNTGMTVGEAVLLRFPHFTPVSENIERVVDRYEKKKRSLNLMDFDDLLLGWKKVLEENEKIREYYSLKYRHILVDEYQDTNRLQAEIIDLSAGAERNLMVVGDDAQSIYSFRGANFENILKFPDNYPGTHIYKLTTNYRSTPEVLRLANEVISHNRNQFHKELRSVAKSGDRPGLVPLKDVFEQSAFVASVMMDMNAEGRSLRDIAVLYRSHYQSMELQMELQRRGIPFEVRSGLTFFEQAHIKDILSFLRIVMNSRDEISWKRIMKLIPGIGNITAGKLWETIREAPDPVGALADSGRTVPKKALEGFHLFISMLQELKAERYQSVPSAAIEYILGHGYEDYLYNSYPNAEMRIEDIQQMSRFAVQYNSLETFLSDLTLQGIAGTDAEAGDDDEGKVVLSTVHQAKGLEWEAVFIIGLNDGKFPSLKSLKSGDEEEERRLFYVGATRAREALYLCYPITADDWNALGFSRPSRFLRELSGDCFEEIAIENV